MPRKEPSPTIQEAVDEFRYEIGYQRPLIVSKPYFPYDHPKGEESYPNAGEPGCYVYASGEGKVKKIGKANRAMGNRIWAPLGRRGNTPEEPLHPDAADWVKNDPDIAVWTVAVPDKHWWLAAALEGFLHEFYLGSRQT